MRQNSCIRFSYLPPVSRKNNEKKTTSFTNTCYWQPYCSLINAVFRTSAHWFFFRTRLLSIFQKMESIFIVSFAFFMSSLILFFFLIFILFNVISFWFQFKQLFVLKVCSRSYFHMFVLFIFCACSVSLRVIQIFFSQKLKYICVQLVFFLILIILFLASCKKIIFHVSFRQLSAFAFDSFRNPH